MEKIIRKIHLGGLTPEEARGAMRREWLLTNGLGGYASGTIAGSVSWRYHGLLIAALPAPFGRRVMLNHLAEYIRMGEQCIQIGGAEPSDSNDEFPRHLTEFRLEDQSPVWRYEVNGVVIEKRVLLLYGQNTVHLTYRLLSGADKIRLELRPSLQFRSHEEGVHQPVETYWVSFREGRYEISSGAGNEPPLRLVTIGHEGAFTHDAATQREIFYRKEADRGYASRGLLWSPGYFSSDLTENDSAVLIASTEPWNVMLAMSPEEAIVADAERRRRLKSAAPEKAQRGPAAELVLAADQFIISPAGRVEDSARARAAGHEIRTVIAGYHWFTDWGRDTMISLEGLTLCTGRTDEAGWILRTFAHYIKDGLIPNMFPEGKNSGLYHTADATLWFFHALHRYVEVTKDRATLKLILPKLVQVVEHHLKGTRFGIRVDPKDGLLIQGEQGYQLTWMDAKVEDWVVTPRRGKAVEINALWHNALSLLKTWLEEAGETGPAQELGRLAERARSSFNERFWNEKEGFLFDVIDGENGNDPACRPNQLLAISLPHPVLEERYWQPVLEVVRKRLLTPVGLRTLSREHPDYKSKYFGDLRARDAAYHQGTVWAWMIGPFIDAWLRAMPEEKNEARKFLDGLIPHLEEACIGSISEIFDAEAPFTARGCIAQAWSVAEMLRCWLKVYDEEPEPDESQKASSSRRANA